MERFQFSGSDFRLVKFKLNKMRTTLITILLVLGAAASKAQFHTLKIPQPSNHVRETQTLGVTDITIDYSSPATRGRDVWNDRGIIPYNAEPIAWRAGANMATTLSFSTDVMIEGKSLKAGTYGFHIVPNDDGFKLIFTDVHQQWGSYYLDLERDITLSVDVSSKASDFSEKLDYEFLNWGENEVTVGLEWADQRIPFKISVDLNKTVIESFRSELRGVNTYRWEAWNDAANWCLNHNTNLEEALTWAERSIYGGYNGFAANSNLANNGTRIRILERLEKEDEMKSAIDEAIKLPATPNEANNFSILLIQMQQYDAAEEFLTKAIKSYPEAWFLNLNYGLTKYFQGNARIALKVIDEVMEAAPENVKGRLLEIKGEVTNGTYQVPNR